MVLQKENEFSITIVENMNKELKKLKEAKNVCESEEVKVLEKNHCSNRIVRNKVF